MAQKQTYAVVFTETTEEHYHIEARSASEATMLATHARWNGEEPLRKAVVGFKVNSPKTVISDPVEAV